MTNLKYQKHDMSNLVHPFEIAITAILIQLTNYLYRFSLKIALVCYERRMFFSMEHLRYIAETRDQLPFRGGVGCS